MKSKITLFIFSLLFCLICNITKAQDTLNTVFKDNSQSYIIKAQGAFNISQIDSALIYLQRAIELDSTNDAAYFLMGRIFGETGNSIGVKRAFKKAYELDNNNSIYGYFWGSLLMFEKQYEQAEQVYKKLIENNPKDENAFEALTNYYFSSGKGREIIELADKFQKKGGNPIPAIEAKYSAYDMLGEKENALKTLFDAYEESHNPMWEALIADHYLKNANDSLAEIYFDRVLSQAPDYPGAIFGKMEITRTNYRIDEFFDYFSKYLNSDLVDNSKKLSYIEHIFKTPYFFQQNTDRMGDALLDFYNASPADTTIGLLASQYNFEVGRKEQAKKIVESLAKTYPSDKKIFQLNASFLYSNQEWKELLDYINRSEQVLTEKNHYDIAQLKGIAQINLKQHDAAISTYKNLEKYAKAANDKDKLLEIYTIIGDLYHEKGNQNECFKYYKKVLKIDPEYCPVLNNYAWYIATSSKKDLDKAQQMSKITIQKESNNSTYLDTYAYILYLRGDLNEAKKYYNQAIAYGNNLSSEIYKHYAECLFALGEYDLAKKYYVNAWKKATDEGDEKQIKLIVDEINSRSDKLGFMIQQ